MADTDDLVPSHGEAEHEAISTSLEIERLDTDLYRSKTLWLPSEARGVFGGQVISQALVAATKSVPESYAAHSLHCYFLLNAKASQPIIYAVERVRQGKTYATRAVKATQSGHMIFILLCSFQIPEPSPTHHQWPFPLNVPDPEQCRTAMERLERYLALPGLGERTIAYLKGTLNDKMKSPIEQRFAMKTKSENGTPVIMHWMRARHTHHKFEAPFQKAILAYLSDLSFLGLVAQTVGLSALKESPKKLGMISTLDHSIWYYDHEFDCADWILYVMESSTSGMGRGLVHGRLYTRAGRLIAVVAQEGVVRASREQAPGEAKL